LELAKRNDNTLQRQSLDGRELRPGTVRMTRAGSGRNKVWRKTNITIHISKRRIFIRFQVELYCVLLGQIAYVCLVLENRREQKSIKRTFTNTDRHKHLRKTM